MQEKDGAGHPRTNAYLKHFTAYSTETNRMHSDYNITLFDFWWAIASEPQSHDWRTHMLYIVADGIGRE
jgi:hypothetical protein